MSLKFMSRQLLRRHTSFSTNSSLEPAIVVRAEDRARDAKVADQEVEVRVQEAIVELQILVGNSIFMAVI